MGVEYDFLTWTSFPSSLKLVNETDREEYVWYRVAEAIPVKGGAKMTLEANMKQASYGKRSRSTSGMSMAGVRIDVWRDSLKGYEGFLWLEAPWGDYDWVNVKYPFSPKAIPSDARYMKVALYAKGFKPATIWFDDLRIYQDGAIIYSNDFSNWKPYIGAGLGAAAVGVSAYLITRKPEYTPVALLGAVVGGVAGLFL
jgi:hypothetical protein